MKTPTVLLLATLLVGALVPLGAQVAVGGRLPSFTLTSGDGHTLKSQDVKGQVVLLLYENKDLKEVNRPLKDGLAVLDAGLSTAEKRRVARVPVIDASGAFWPFTSIWQDNLTKNSQIEGLTIYGDWDGKLKKDLGFVTDEVYVVLVDSGGTVRWYKKGQVSHAEARQLEDLLMGLVKGQP